MFLESNEEILDHVTRLIGTHDAAEPIAIAVAFWGAGAESMLPPGKRFRVICNLAMGGTNPAVIETLMSREGIDVRHLPDLHAKVIVASGGALVSSANFSANGLGLEGGDGVGWQEAGVSIAAEDPEFGKVLAWFEQRWRASMSVDAIVLDEARMAWAARTPANTFAEADEAASNTVPTGADDSLPELREADLFQPKIKPRNPLRMAADWLVEEYEVMRGGKLSPSDNYIPAYAAHLLWTLAGKRMATNIRATPEFSRPEQVMRRADEISLDNPDRVRNLVGRIARSTSAPPAVRYWAQRFNESKLA